jgi:16S rRNA (guanine527-N7)-methyltransferase
MSAMATSAAPRTGVRSRPPLPDLAAAAGIELDATALAHFDAYRDLLLDWNARFNLTAITDPAEIDRRLFLDALLLLPAVDAVSPDGDRPKRLADVGSGGGFPGLALKIARPELAVTLIEATGKKVAFLEACLDELALDDAVAIHARAEEVGHDPSHRGRYDLATARAVAALPALLELCVPLLRPGGRALFPKGLDLATEIGAGRRAAPLVGARLVANDVLPGGQTTLIVAEKIGSTPSRYPRRPGVPARDPLGTAPPPFRGGNEPARSRTGKQGPDRTGRKTA